MSIRRSAILWLAVLMTIIGAVSAATSYALMQAETDNFLDSQLRQIAFYIGDSPGEPLHSAPTDPLYDPEDDFVVQIWGAGAKTIYDSDPDIAVPRQADNGFSNLSTARNSWRTYTFVTPGRTVQISQDMVVRHELAAGAALRSAIPVAVIFMLSWALLSLVIDRVMRRLGSVIAIVQAQDATTRRPIPLDAVPLEIRPLVMAMNELMDRLQQAMDRQRRFVSDAAHELRTPLAALALQIGNLRAVARSPELRERIDDAEAGARRANSLVSQLLRLARFESQSDGGPLEGVDLARLVDLCASETRPLADSKSIDIRLLLDRPVIVHGRAAELKVMISNILENAIKYTKPGGTIEASTALRADRAILSIKDTGPGIPEHMMERVFERYVRVPNNDAEGSGLGLSIVRSIAERHNISVRLANRASMQGLEVRLEARREAPAFA